MEESNVNRLNGIPNFGYGFPEEHESIEESGEGDEGVEVGETTLGVEEGTESTVEETGSGDRVE